MRKDQTKKSLEAELKSYFGFDTFKGSQKEVIESVMEGCDTFVIMPTGGGKSLTYQLPALLLEGTAIIVSPLIALMKNQVDAIRGVSTSSGVAHVLNSSLNKTEVETVKSDIKSGLTKLLYVAPESLTKDEYVEFLTSVKISFCAVDEAHCISEWGHDFRPEYRNLKAILGRIQDMHVIALTATATPKVQEDIQKNLGMTNAKVFKSSFNRPNLFYEVRPKVNVQPEIIKFVKARDGKSGIIYCLSRKKVEELAEVLKVNGVSALPYHAGLDAKTRARNQDMFLMEDVDVIVATIAFGMGIDKPDVRFVIHHDMPKSLESYYQETGRAGRDGGEGHCTAFYSYKDIEKLEKFLVGKPVAEQEIGNALLQDVVAYAETAMSRRKFILHYFGEEFDEINGEGAQMDDNALNPKTLLNVQEELGRLMELVAITSEKFRPKELTNILIGNATANLKGLKVDQKPYFNCGSDQDAKFWMSLIRQSIVAGFFRKEIEQYGVLHPTEKAAAFKEKPFKFEIAIDHDYSKMELDVTQPPKVTSGSDKILLKHLKDLRKKVARSSSVPPYAVFQDASLEDMALQYPTTLDELTKIFGVGDGKARKYGKKFVQFIKDYVEENDIVRPDDIVIKSVANKSAFKVYIIQSTDRKLSLQDIADNKSITMEALIKEIESIVNAGTKVNIGYYIDGLLEEDQQEELFDYFMESETDSIEDAMEEFDEEYDENEIRLMRIKFMSEVAN